ncbi:hypothetical protein G7Y89_g12999 [Cudoniella acicularis]|uniref:PNPLA domain-containing protein n=1 Tax=Cudoniella acicularis TaxID=354080 RepID=A0A8H4VZ42_9HELO|nr:hypothetical protein G7Y89_g12999 [Cudoniella acicularis]
MERVESRSKDTSNTDIDKRVASLVASCISIDTAQSGSFHLAEAEPAFSDYEEMCNKAYSGFLAPARCGYRSTEGEHCQNNRTGHEKGYQNLMGRIMVLGYYQSLSPTNGQEIFVKGIRHNYLARANRFIERKYDVEQFKTAIINEHRMTLKGAKFWKRTKSNNTCFFCLTNYPDHTLLCRHAICEMCIEQFGDKSATEPDVFSFESSWSIRLVREGVGMKILSLDGGGIRVVIPATILKILETKINTNIPLHEFFDIVVSTSGIIALGFGCNRWSAANCLAQFKSPVRGVFVRHFAGTIPLVKYAVLYFLDSGYRDGAVEEQLKFAFAREERRLLFGHVEGGGQQRRPLKVGVSARRCTDSQSVLFANYNQKMVADEGAAELCGMGQPEIGRDPRPFGDRLREESKPLKKTAQALIASSFYLKVPKISQATQISYDVKATIMCRLESQYHPRIAQGIFKEYCMFCVKQKKWKIDNILNGSAIVEMPITYMVASPSDKTSLYLAFGMNAPAGSQQHNAAWSSMYHIGGSP